MRVNYWNDITLAYQRISQGAQLIETACGPIQYTEFGEGPTVLMVHGAGGGYDQGEYFATLIGGNYRWIVPSRFGFLGTPVPEGANSSLQAGAYISLLDALGIDRVGVVGVSMGGPSSLLFAQHYPQRTTSLVLISAASHAISPRPALLAALFNVFLNDFVFWSLVRLSPEMLLVALGVPSEVQKQLSSDEIRELHAFLESIIPMGSRRTGQNLEQHMSEYDADQIKDIQVPTLVLHARDDTLVGMEHSEFTTRSIPGSQFNIMEKGGHLALMLRRNVWAKQKVVDFLKQHNSR
jgi:pimeloyl-ACP methyl ester carboxylesterase